MINSCLYGRPKTGDRLTRRAWPVVMLTLCLILAGCAIPGKTTEPLTETPAAGFDALMAAGDEAYAKTDLDTAQVKFALAVKQRPDDVAALYKLGIVHYQKKSFDVAQEVLLRVIAGKDHPVLNYKAGALERLGLIAFRQENLDLAATRFREALQQQPKRWRSLSGLGVVADMQSRHTDAQRQFRKALALAPGSAQIENNLGYSFYLQGDYSQAQQHFLTATRRNPDYEKAWSNLGLSLVRQSRYEEARSVFARLAKTHVVSNNLGYLGMLQGDFERAETELNTAQRQAPSYYGVASENLELLRQRSQQQADLNTLLPGMGVDTPANDSQSTTRAASPPALDSLIIVPASSQPVTASVRSVVKTAPKPVVTRKQAKPKLFTAGLPEQLLFLGYLTSSNGQSASSASVSQAIRSLQVNYNLELTGRTNLATRKVLKKLVIERVQTYLSLLGFSSEDVSGDFGRGTKQAIRLFKKEQSLSGGSQVTNGLLRELASKFD